VNTDNRILACGIVIAALSTAVNAQQLPKSGSINFHTGWKVAGEALNGADKYALGHGSAIGSTFNEKGWGRFISVRPTASTPS
jgi:hypothetical protein